MENCKKDRKVIEVICQNCNQAFKKTASEYKRNEKQGNKHFCTLKCSIEYKKKCASKQSGNCCFCGKEISYEKRKNKFCSSNCSASHNNKNRVGEKRVFSEKAIKNITAANNKRYNVSEYYNSPNYCKECKVILKFGQRSNIFCGINCKKAFDSKNMTEFNKYKSKCSFTFNLKNFPNEFNFTLINQFGWYSAKNRGNNLKGVSRDHMLSIMEGFSQNIDSKIISHPANCELMIHSNNSKKWKNSSITIEELKNKIIQWDSKYGKFYEDLKI